MKAVSLMAIAAGLALAACQPPASDAAEMRAAAGPAPVPEPTTTPPPSPPTPDPALAAFLKNRTRDAMAPLRYVARTHGQGESRLTLVYLVGPEYCGSGGCNLLILRRTGDAYELLGETTVTRPPIRILSTTSNGLPDIGVHVSGGGVVEGYEARLAFDGRRYPRNPTVAPARRVDGADGIVLIEADDPGTPLKE